MDWFRAYARRFVSALKEPKLCKRLIPVIDALVYVLVIATVRSTWWLEIHETITFSFPEEDGRKPVNVTVDFESGLYAQNLCTTGDHGNTSCVYLLDSELSDHLRKENHLGRVDLFLTFYPLCLICQEAASVSGTGTKNSIYIDLLWLHLVFRMLAYRKDKF